MSYVLNIIYALGLLVVVVVGLVVRHRKADVFLSFRRKLLGAPPRLPDNRPVVWIHASSVGEALVCRPVLERLRLLRPDLQYALSVTTSEGFGVATREFSDIPVFFTPYDFTWAVHRVFRALDPKLFVIAENDFWPNMLREAHRHGVPVAIFNTRMSRQERIEHALNQWLLRPALRKVRWWGAVTHEDAAWIQRFFKVGSPPLEVVGSLKLDGALRDPENPQTRELRAKFGFASCERILVAGSTHHPEERQLVEVIMSLADQYPMLRLILVPRNIERFGSVAGMLERRGIPFVRASAAGSPHSQSSLVTLVDSMGHLRDVWGLASFAFVGGSLARHGGQNMAEPASYGIPICFGPHVWNFQDVADELLAAGAAVQVESVDLLRSTIRHWLDHPQEAEYVGSQARDVVRRSGAAVRATVRGLLALLPVQARKLCGAP
jgi:3-deoxy-D-manno-octulosonic-acid transferase